MKMKKRQFRRPQNSFVFPFADICEICKPEPNHTASQNILFEDVRNWEDIVSINIKKRIKNNECDAHEDGFGISIRID